MAMGGASLTRKEGDVTNGQSVLVLDRTSETADVLRAVLEPRGVRVDEFPRPSQTQSPSNPPSVIVLDAESISDSPSPTHWNNVPQVIIGRIHCEEPAAESGARHYLHKPFHYAELVQAIESLIAR